MAANYWLSSQRLQWQMTRDQLQELRNKLEEEDVKKGLVTAYPLPDYRVLNIYYHVLIQKMGRRMNIRQQALATAEIYLKRFYTKVSIRESNIYLMVATSVYLACKMEECPQHIRTIVSESKTIFQDFISTDTTKLAECEFHLIAELNSYLIVHHPYRTLHELQSILKLSMEEFTSAWAYINDSYVTDLLLIYPPHIIAVTAIFLTLIAKPQYNQSNVHAASASAMSLMASGASNAGAMSGQTNAPTGNNLSSVLAAANAAGNSQQSARSTVLTDWCAESGIDIEAVIECTQEMISMYDVWDSMSEKSCKEQIIRMIRGRQLVA